MTPNYTVVKIGGSLLDRPELTKQIRGWQCEQPPPAIHFFLVGGGRKVDALRERHARGELTDAQAHWAAIEVMDANARRLAGEMRIPVETSLDTLSHACFFAPGEFLRNVEPTLPGETLPVGWQVTSDSIAARFAAVLKANLVLLKTVPPPGDAVDISALADCGYVDEYFPTASLEARHVEFQTL